MSAINIHLTAFSDDCIDQLAQHIVAQQSGTLPLLTNTIVFTAQANIAAVLRKYLLELSAAQGFDALLGPTIIPLQHWLKAYQPGDINVINSTTQELMLVEALKQQQSIFESANPWVYANGLLQLFQELTANKIKLPDNPEDFTRKISLAYGINEANSEITAEALSREAQFVYTLWNAWHEQLAAYEVVDTQTALSLSLSNSLEHLDKQYNFYLLGYEQLSRTQSQWLENIAEKNNVHLFIQGQITKTNNTEQSYHPQQYLIDCIKQFPGANIVDNKDSISARLDFLNNVYNINTLPLLERAQTYSKQHPQSPLTNVHVFAANSAEQEARAIDIQCRHWLIEGKTNLAIVTENRRLARRVRALLERSGVHLQDSAGWALSTTRAAATLERWLECIENDFDYLSLLDLLKSAFIFPGYDRETLQYAVYRLEQDIIRHENISQNLEAYRAGIKSRLNRLPDWFEETHSVLSEVLNKLEQASEPLKQLYQQDAFTPQKFVQAISASLKLTGLDSSFAADDAGIKIISLLESLSVESELVKLEVDWSEARAWLGMQLERSRFMPPASTTQVQLIGLSQSQFQNFDGLIIASVEDEFLPGSPSPSAFFNDAVKYELGLQTSLQQKNERYYHFLRLLNASENILLSYCNQGDNGETVKPGAWLSILEQFHELAYQSNLNNSKLQALVNSIDNTFTCQAEHPATSQQQPAPVLPANLIPEKISASQYQEIINCPYLYYAARCLKLEATEELRLALSKADYGERIHLCLQALHEPVKGLPGPFKNKITEQNKDAATKLLEEIINAVFKPDLNENHEHQAWYLQAIKMVPHYIQWQTKHNQGWDIYKLEETVKREININNCGKPLTLSGRLDRIDKNQDGLSVIDYKTGTTSSNKDVEAGEQVQLPFYHTLLQDDDNPVVQVEYLEVKSNGVKSKGKLSGDKLNDIANQSAQRLQEIFSQLHTQTALPAWGNKETCERCVMQGICRKQMWQD